jgi:hypothetical protein
MINELYKTSYRISLLLLFKTKVNALVAANYFLTSDKVVPYFYGTTVSDTKVTKNFWENKLDIKIKMTNPHDVIFVISKEIYDKVELWHCIIGEKTGWIVAKDQRINLKLALIKIEL